MLAEKIGLDATIFIRFTKMLRNIFTVASLVGCLVMIPVNIAERNKEISKGQSVLRLMTPLYVFGNAFWSNVICCYLFNGIVAYFLWHSYRRVVALKTNYFQSSEYQHSLHARTVMITDLPTKMRNDEGLLKVADEVNPTGVLPRAAVGRNVKLLPDLVAEHREVVLDLESVLAKYLRSPDNLPAQRPRMKAPKQYDGERINGKVDSIDYLTARIAELETKIRDVRDRIDKRDAMSYGFASWEIIEDAHAVAYSARKTHPQGTTIQLAPRPNDLIWENLGLSKAKKKTKRMINWGWVTILTLLWTPINGAIAIFLSNLQNLGSVWNGFNEQLLKNKFWWALVQGVAAPAITSAVYLVLPIIFRRLSIRSGDLSKSSREHHVLHNLYAFFIFNNLIVFSFFSAVWSFVSSVIDAKNSSNNIWDAIKAGEFYLKVMISLCQVSPFWITYLLQRNLGAAIDLAQLVHLSTIWFSRTFLSPTPRQNIEWTAPIAFDYASYENYFLFYATIALCYSTLQPLVLPITALYFGLDSILKKYLLMYVFVTKTESVGSHWRVLYNRLVFACILSNFIIGLVVAARGTWIMVGVIVPAPILLLAFKFYCARTFDDKLRFVVTTGMKDAERNGGDKIRRTGQVAVKFGHPALYKPLMTPMVHAKAQHVLGQVYRGRLNSDAGRSVAFSDIAMEPMNQRKDSSPFEFVSDAQQDFAFFKDRDDFREEGGEIYGRPEDLITERSQTPKSFMYAQTGPNGQSFGSNSREGSPSPAHRAPVPRKEVELTHVHPAFRLGADTRESSQDREPAIGDLGMRHSVYTDPDKDESQLNLLGSAGPIDGHAPITTPLGEQINEQLSMDRWRTGGSGYGRVDQQDQPGSYDYFRWRR